MAVSLPWPFQAIQTPPLQTVNDGDALVPTPGIPWVLVALASIAAENKDSAISTYLFMVVLLLPEILAENTGGPRDRPRLRSKLEAAWAMKTWEAAWSPEFGG